ncbi:MAG: heme-binding domain-containing protein [Bdellovibrionales bacterium]
MGIASSSFAHKNRAPPEVKTQPQPPEADVTFEHRLEKINESYKREVKPIFQRSCFNCHSQSPRLPWYHSLPLIHRLLENDMKEAKVHLDFSNDFPFTGHGSPKEDLQAIAESIEDKSMPPFRYKIMHWKSALSEKERKLVLKWTTESRRLLAPPEDKKH